MFNTNQPNFIYPSYKNGLFVAIMQLETYHENLCNYTKIEIEKDGLANETKLSLLKEVTQIGITLKNLKFIYEQAKNRTNKQGSNQSTIGSTKEIRGGYDPLRENELQEIASELTTYSRTIRSGCYFQLEEESENGGSIYQ
jgi:hypothetical protein